MKDPAFASLAAGRWRCQLQQLTTGTRLAAVLGLLAAAAVPQPCGANRTATWTAKRAALVGAVYGRGDGVLPTRSVPDKAGAPAI